MESVEKDSAIFLTTGITEPGLKFQAWLPNLRQSLILAVGRLGDELRQRPLWRKPILKSCISTVEIDPTETLVADEIKYIPFILAR